jgi:hypothetical protein
MDIDAGRRRVLSSLVDAVYLVREGFLVSSQRNVTTMLLLACPYMSICQQVNSGAPLNKL